nr:hypothetical protein [Zoogloeaceae bacterium]
MTEPVEPQVQDAAAAARLCAALLALGGGFARWSLVLAALAFAVLFWHDLGPAGLAAVLASLACGALAAYHASRVRLDAALFDAWARRWSQADAAPAEDMAAFDRALAGLRTATRPSRSGRTLALRCVGARGLLARQCVYTVLQTLSLLVAALVCV